MHYLYINTRVLACTCLLVLSLLCCNHFGSNNLLHSKGGGIISAFAQYTYSQNEEAMRGYMPVILPSTNDASAAKFFSRDGGGSFCPGGHSCSGHGWCRWWHACTCAPGYTGPDCSQRTCPSGIAWAGKPSQDLVAHTLLECSNNGLCNRDSGKCECFPGFGGDQCQRSKCQNGCNGRGVCLDISAINDIYSQRLAYDTNYDNWDKKSTTSCVCDQGYTGAACEIALCPKGDDPLTPKTGYLKIRIQTKSNEWLETGSFRMKFNGHSFIFPAAASSWSNTACKNSFEGLRSIDKVACTKDSTDALINGGTYTVTLVSFSSQNFDNNIFSNDGAPSASQFVCESFTIPTSAGATCEVSVVAENPVRVLGELKQCSNRGVCNYFTGACQCFPNFISPNCGMYQPQITVSKIGFSDVTKLISSHTAYTANTVRLTTSVAPIESFNYIRITSRNKDIFTLDSDGNIAMRFGGLNLANPTSGVKEYIGGIKVGVENFVSSTDGLVIKSGGLRMVSTAPNTNWENGIDGGVFVVGSFVVTGGQTVYNGGLFSGGRLNINKAGLRVASGGFVNKAGGMTISNSGIRIVAGGVTVNSGGIIVTRGGLTVFNMGLAVTGGITLNAPGIGYKVGGGITLFSVGLVVSGGISVHDAGLVINGGLSISTGGFNVPNALTLNSGGLIVTGGLSCLNGGLSISSGGLVVSSGGGRFTGGLRVTNGLTVNSVGMASTGGLSILSGGLVLTGGFTVQTGGLLVTNGVTIRTGGLITPYLSIRDLGARTTRGITIYNMGVSVNQGMTISDGGLNVNGPLTIVAAGLKITGGVSITNGGLLVTGGFTVASGGINSIGSSARLSINNGGLRVTGGFSLMSGGLNVVGSVTVLNGGGVYVANGATIFGPCVIDAGGLTINNQGIVITGGVTTAGGGVLLALGSLNVANNGIKLAGPLNVDNTGVSVTGGLTVTTKGFLTSLNMKVTGSGLSVTGGITVANAGIYTSGGLTIASGGFVITGGIATNAGINVEGAVDVKSGGLVVAAGGVTIAASGLALTGGLTLRNKGLAINAAGVTVNSGGIKVVHQSTIYDIGMFINTGGLTIDDRGIRITGGLTIQDSGLLLQGGMTIRSGGLYVTGGATVNNNGVIVTGGVTIDTIGIYSDNFLQINSAGVIVTGGVSVYNTGIFSPAQLIVNSGGLRSTSLNINLGGMQVIGGMSIRNKGVYVDQRLLVTGDHVSGGRINLLGDKGVYVGNALSITLGGLTQNGHLGVTVNEGLEVNGACSVYGVINLQTTPNTASDQRLKTNIAVIDEPLAKLKKLRGVYFYWKDPENFPSEGIKSDKIEALEMKDSGNISAGLNVSVNSNNNNNGKDNTSSRSDSSIKRSRRDISSHSNYNSNSSARLTGPEKSDQQLARRHVGVIAQDVKAVIPEAVYSMGDKYLGVQYDGLVPLLVEGVKAIRRRVMKQKGLSRSSDGSYSLCSNLISEFKEGGSVSALLTRVKQAEAEQFDLKVQLDKLERKQ